MIGLLHNISQKLIALGAYKDFFWIVFTWIATLTSILTYFNVRKSLKKSLYDHILEVQLQAYETLLQGLKQSSGDISFPVIWKI